MKTLKIVTVLLFLVCIASCTSDDDNTPVKTMYEHISENEELSILKAALEKDQQIIDILSDEDSELLTLFAPTNAAFEALFGEGVSVDDYDITILQNYINNHIMKGKVLREAIEDEGSGYLKVLSNHSLFFNISEGVIELNGNARIIDKEYEAVNGVLHVVDAAIAIPTLNTFIEADPKLSIIREVLEIVEVEQGSSIPGELTENMADRYTFFIPNNDAFNSLYEEIELISDIDDIGNMALEDIVEMHVIPYVDRTSTYITNRIDSTIDTEGGVFAVGVNSSGDYTLTDTQGRLATIVMIDVRADNGYMHIIDRVLLPE